MSLFGNIFSKKPTEAQAPLLTPPPASPPPPGAPAMLKAWDAYGRICEIPREEWRTKVLPHNFRNSWNKPEELANLINSALNDGFIADCLEPARRLHQIDPDQKRATTYFAVILLQLKQFDEAERIISDTLRKHGEDGVLLTNLAKAYSGKGDAAHAESTLWHALEVDPNLDNGLMWYQAIHRDRGGEPAAQEAFRRVAALPGSWRPQMWLARAALQARNFDQAIGLYQEALARVAAPVPTILLMQMSGDLGNAGRLPEILQLVEPHFDAKTHGLQVGNNLIKAHVDLGQLDAARRILDQLYAQNRPDWKENLSYWDTEIAKARLKISSNSEAAQMKVAMLTIEGPVWLKPTSPAAELFPAPAGNSISVAFLGSSMEIASNSKRVEQKMADTPGRMSRALPLFLAEQVAFNSNAHVQTLVPWVVGDNPGFVLGGVPWKDEDAANYARQGQLKSDYVVVTHLKPNTEPWTAELRLVRTIDGKCLGTLAATWPLSNPEKGIPELARQLLTLLAEQAELTVSTSPPAYQVPAAPQFAGYLLRLEQLLAVRCAGMDGVKGNFLNGEREIIDGNLKLCLDHPQNVGARILLAQTLMVMKRARPDILPEFKDKLTLLQKEKSLPEPAHGVLQRMFNEVLA